MFTGMPRLLALATSICVGAALSMTAAGQSGPVELRVDLAQQKGPVPYMYRAGVFLNSLPAGYPMRMFFADQRPGMLEFSWDFYEPLLNASTEAEFFERLPGSNLALWVRETVKAGGEPYIRLMPVPRWLWSDRDGFRKPPRDLQGWERFVGRIVDYFNNQQQLPVRYIVWDEPDGFWKGTTEQYLQLYKHAAAGLLRANPEALIGGPAPVGFRAGIGGKRSPPLLPIFVRYCATTPLPGLAERLPINILVWHTFDAAPMSPGQYDDEVRLARALLTEHGYTDVELNIGSWSPLEQYPEAQNARDSEFLGSFIVSSVIAMHRAGVDRHAFFNLYEDWRINRDEFANDLGLTTRRYIAKAGYHAYRLLGRLQGNHIPISVSDPFVQATASFDGTTLRVLASNFPPPRRMLLLSTTKHLAAIGYTREQARRYVPDRKKLEQMIRDRKQIEAWDAPPEMRAALLELHDMGRLSAQRQQNAIDLQIVVDGLPAGRYRLREYRTDVSSGNPYRQREAVERLLRQNRVEEINRNVSESMTRARDRELSLQGRAQSMKTSLPAFGVLMLEAERLD